MLHIAKLVERRFPNNSGTIVSALLGIFALALVAGIVLLLVN